MGYVDFDNLSADQQAQVIALRPKLKREELSRLAFFVTRLGAISKRNGHHQLTDRAGKEIDAMLRAGRTARSKGDLQDWTGSPIFHISKG